MSNDVSFGSTKVMGFLGILAGALIAVGIPWIALDKAGAAGLGGFACTLLSVIGILGGVALGIVSAFFSIAIPSKVSKE